MEQAYFSSEVAKSLGVGASTLRKYSLALEAAGYHFDRGLNNSRVFYQKDVITMQRIIRAVNEKNMSLDSAIEQAVKQQITAPAEEQQPADHSRELIKRITRLEKQQETLIEVNKELVKELAQNQRWIQEKLTNIEHQQIAVRDRLLLEGLQQSKTERSIPSYSLPSFLSLFKRKKKTASFN